MTEPHHTPGPWTVQNGAVYDAHGSRLLVADRDNPQTRPAERDRNVRLAAAAPGMLDALQRIADMTSIHPAAVYTLRARARAAIRRVEEGSFND